MSYPRTRTLKIKIEIPMYQYEIDEIYEGGMFSAYSGLLAAIYSTINQYKNPKGKKLDGLRDPGFNIEYEVTE